MFEIMYALDYCCKEGTLQSHGHREETVAKRHLEMEWNPYAAECPTRMILDRVADKWTVLVLGLLVRAPMRFNALRREIEGLSQKVLSQTLKNLERDGLVRRQAFATVPVTVEYSITPLGKTLAGIVGALSQWAQDNADAIIAARKKYDSAK